MEVDSVPRAKTRMPGRRSAPIGWMTLTPGLLLLFVTLTDAMIRLHGSSPYVTDRLNRQGLVDALGAPGPAHDRRD